MKIFKYIFAIGILAIMAVVFSGNIPKQDTQGYLAPWPYYVSFWNHANAEGGHHRVSKLPGGKTYGYWPGKGGGYGYYPSGPATK